MGSPGQAGEPTPRSLLLAHHVTGPLRALTAVTEAMAAGQLAPPVTPAGPDEMVRLGQTFNHMAAQVQETLTRQRARDVWPAGGSRSNCRRRHGEVATDLAGSKTPGRHGNTLHGTWETLHLAW